MRPAFQDKDVPDSPIQLFHQQYNRTASRLHQYFRIQIFLAELSADFFCMLPRVEHRRKFFELSFN
jgi:hypothetical protein